MLYKFLKSVGHFIFIKNKKTRSTSDEKTRTTICYVSYRHMLYKCLCNSGRSPICGCYQRKIYLSDAMAKRGLNPSPYLIPGQSSLERSSHLSNSDEFKRQTVSEIAI